MSGIANIVFGLILVGGGVSGKLAFRGTQSGTALAVVGFAMIFLGLVRLARGNRQ